MPKIKVYSHLTLSANDVRKIIPNAIVCPPVGRGDILKDIDAGFHIVAMVDGKFDQVLSVSPGEIMDALRCGVTVYGSSSMGALRAIETEQYGMIGIGKIVDHIRSSGYFRDDLLGQIFASSSHGYRSETFIDFYFRTNRLVEQKKIPSQKAKTLIRLYSKLHYSERSAPALRALLSRKGLGSDDIMDCVETIFASRFSQKREDALEMLRRINSDIARVSRRNKEIHERAKKSKDPFQFYPSWLVKDILSDEIGRKRQRRT